MQFGFDWTRKYVHRTFYIRNYKIQGERIWHGKYKLSVFLGFKANTLCPQTGINKENKFLVCTIDLRLVWILCLFILDVITWTDCLFIVIIFSLDLFLAWYYNMYFMLLKNINNTYFIHSFPYVCKLYVAIGIFMHFSL